MAMSCDQTVEVLRAAGEPTRLRILALLAREELFASEIRPRETSLEQYFLDVTGDEAR